MTSIVKGDVDLCIKKSLHYQFTWLTNIYQHHHKCINMIDRKGIFFIGNLFCNHLQS
jgi:hypothetical protein